MGTGATQHFTLTVDQAPKLTSAASAKFTVGSTGSFLVTAPGYPAPMFSETGALPSGVTLTKATGQLAGKSAATTGGLYKVTVTATNGVGSAAVQSFTLSVTRLRESPVPPRRRSPQGRRANSR